MAVITNLIMHRRDGRQITEAMRIGDVGRLGWPIDIVVKLTWQADERPASLDDAQGLAVKIVNGRHFLAVMGRLETPAQDMRLFVVNADGSIRHAVADRQIVQSTAVDGHFRWTEEAFPDKEDCFAGVFEHPNGEMFRVNIDARSGDVLSVQKTR